jgi:hypothetical protein
MEPSRFRQWLGIDSFGLYGSGFMSAAAARARHKLPVGSRIEDLRSKVQLLKCNKIVPIRLSAKRLVPRIKKFFFLCEINNMAELNK